MPDTKSAAPRHSRSAEAARRVEIERVREMSPLERAQLALRLGRRDRAVRRMAVAAKLGVKK